MEEGYKRNRKEYVIGIDFDGTIVTHNYPDIGKPVPFAKEVIAMLNENGHKCFLFTMRDGERLEEARKYCIEAGIDLVGYNESPDQFSTSPKQYGTFYIDDVAIGCPLTYNKEMSRKPYVNWYEVGTYLWIYGLLTEEQLKVISDERIKK